MRVVSGEVLIAYLALVTVLMLTPGPDMLFVLASGVRSGSRAGFVAAVGVAVGETIHLLAAAAGLAALFQAAPLLYETIFSVREHGVGVGLALTLGTPVANLEPVITLVDAILLLARVTGEGARGAAFNPLVLPRVRAVHDLVTAAGATVDIQVAGGVNRRHVTDLAGAGATALALGAGLYKVPDMAAEVSELRALATSALAPSPSGRGLG